MATTDDQAARTQPIIRLALLAGVVVFGAVAMYLAKTGAVAPLDPDTLGLLRVAFIVVLAGTAIAMYLMRKKRLAASSAPQILSLNIVGWALGEAVALMGAVLLLLSGNAIFYLVGFVMMLVSFVFFPIPREH